MTFIVHSCGHDSLLNSQPMLNTLYTLDPSQLTYYCNVHKLHDSIFGWLVTIGKVEQAIEVNSKQLAPCHPPQPV